MGPRLEKGVEIESFQLNSVDGMVAHLGTLLYTEERWQLTTADNRRTLILLTDVPEQLSHAQGAVVWVAGTWLNEAFSVKSFGVKPED